MNAENIIENPRILIVDDLSDNLESLSMLINSVFAGAKLFQAASGAEAIELAFTHLPDVILMDILMPEMDGYTACRTIKQNPMLQATPVVFLTALKSDRENRLMALEAGGEAFLSKPVDRIELKSLLTVLLRLKYHVDLKAAESFRLQDLVNQQTELLQKELADRKKLEEALQARITLLASPDLSFDELSMNDLFDIDELQDLQDRFSRATRVASIIITPDGIPVTRPSNFCCLCNDLNMATPKGHSKCICFDAEIGRQNSDGVVVISCLDGGLWNAFASITIGDQHVANWFIGQVRKEQLDRERMKLYAMEIGADPDKFVEELMKVEVMSEQQFRSVADSLLSISRQLSWKAYQNVQQARLIGQMQKSEELLREKELLFQAFMDSHSDQMFIKDEEMRYVLVNKSALAFYNLQPEQIIGKTDADIFSPEFAGRCAAADQQVLISGKEFIVEDSIGDIVLEIKKFPVKLKNNNVGIGGIIRDITQRRKYEDAIEQSRQSYYDVINSVSEAIYIQDPASGAFIDVNKGAEMMYGMPREMIIGQTPETIAAPGLNNISLIWQHSQEAFQTGIPARFDFWAVRGNGEIFPKEVIVNRGKYFGREVMIATARDITQQKRAEEDLFNTIARNKALLDANPDMMFVFDGDGRIIDYYAKNISDLYQEPFLFIGRIVDEVLPGDVARMTHEKIQEVLKTNQLQTYNYQLKLGNHYRSYESRYVLSGKNQVLSIVRDVTEYRRSEDLRDIQYQLGKAMADQTDLPEFFQRVHQQLNRVMDATNFYIALYDSTTGMLHAPYQFDKGGIIDQWKAEKSCTGLVISENRSIVLSRADGENLLAQGVIEDVGVVPESWLGVPLRDGDNVIGAVVVQDYETPDAYNESDIAALEAAARHVFAAIKRRDDEQLIRLMSKSVEQSPVSIIITNAKGIIEYVNPKFSDVTGYSFEEAVGQNPRILKSGEQAPAVYHELWHSIVNGKSWTGELHNRRKNAELFWESVNISPIIDKSGNISNFIAIKEDITSKKNLMDELISASEKALESDHLKSAFLNNISHEIRTPFNGILGFLALINDDEITAEERRHYTSIINKSADRLMNTLNDIVEVSKIQTGQATLMPVAERLNSFISSIELENCERVGKKDLKFIVSNHVVSHDYTFFADFPKLRIAINHILNNAVKFTSEGSVRFDVDYHDANLVFKISDTGVGIPDEKLQIIFEPFMQGDNSSTRGYEGTGLGLTIARAYIHLMNGRLEAKSTLGSGTAFTITLTLKPEPSNDLSEKAKLSLPLKSSLSAKVILVAEDDDANFFYTSEVLLKAGYSVLRAVNGVEVVDRVKNRPDISALLLDVKMPLMDGYSALKLLRVTAPELPVIALTAYAFPADRMKAFEAGCNEYLSKPVVKNELLRVLARVVGDAEISS